MVPHGDRVDSAESRTVQGQHFADSFCSEQDIVRVLILYHDVDDLPLRALSKPPWDHSGQSAKANDEGRERTFCEHSRKHTSS